MKKIKSKTPPKPATQRLLCLDLGRKTGWAVFIKENSKPVDGGTWNLDEGSFVEDEMLLLEELLGVIYLSEKTKFHGIAIEAAKHQQGKASELWFGRYWMVKLFAYQHGLPIFEYSPPAIKKFATGSGNDKPEDVLRAAQERLVDYKIKIVDDNHAVALWLGFLHLATYKGLL
jgi:Holliday junction resolvasome RuvABC endonuclease subunit